MSLIRPCLASRLALPVVSVPKCAPALSIRHNSTKSGESAAPALKASASDAPSDKVQSTSLRRIADAPGAMTRHKLPDYDHPIDYATSQFSPVPKAVMDGSEEGEVLPAAVLSGAPIELQARTVRIYRPTKPATQSGDWHGHVWRMDWDVLQKGHRWENPLMGWQSTADFMHCTHLDFKSKEDAINFAEKQGYEYFVQVPNERKFAPKAYANNFLYAANKLKHIRTK